jgi:hypothetical protein
MTEEKELASWQLNPQTKATISKKCVIFTVFNKKQI